MGWSSIVGGLLPSDGQGESPFSSPVPPPSSPVPPPSSPVPPPSSPVPPPSSPVPPPSSPVPPPSSPVPPPSLSVHDVDDRFDPIGLPTFWEDIEEVRGLSDDGVRQEEET
ncbi:hypothetical protein ZOSMA_3G00540 [Zostera marina]|uniref:Uncharacterized protein n=1 Tax=Zostera marina TaxID=29655 RepID=A0A0K9P3K7_ZOSMR|nr:hypothetical protein ZOSMA_3G00540 [Zostera marina]